MKEKKKSARVLQGERVFFIKNNADTQKREKGFSLIEVIVGIALVAIALLGLAQLFTFSLMNNTRSDRMTSATFLAQQRIDMIRNLTADEISILVSTSPIDETPLIDVNGDGIGDFRRITDVSVSPSGVTWDVRVCVFPASQETVAVAELLQNPIENKVRADITTVISR